MIAARCVEVEAVLLSGFLKLVACGDVLEAHHVMMTFRPSTASLPLKLSTTKPLPLRH